MFLCWTPFHKKQGLHLPPVGLVHVRNDDVVVFESDSDIDDIVVFESDCQTEWIVVTRLRGVSFCPWELLD